MSRKRKIKQCKILLEQKGNCRLPVALDCNDCPDRIVYHCEKTRRANCLYLAIQYLDNKGILDETNSS